MKPHKPPIALAKFGLLFGRRENERAGPYIRRGRGWIAAETSRDIPNNGRSAGAHAAPLHLLAAVAVVWFAFLSWARPAYCDPWKYEPYADPNLGVHLVSWWNYGSSGPTIWANAVLSVYNAGVRQISIDPVRFFDATTGAIAPSSQHGPDLIQLADPIALAKSLGMTVTVSPFIEYEDFAQWRANWDPAPGGAVSNQFWTDYQQYLVEVAQLAENNGADAMNVGTELRGLVQNSGNNAHWNETINAVAANFSGQLGYAANWDDFQNANLTNAIWNNPAIDYMGVDAYHPLATVAQADSSGADPNPAFIQQLTDNLNSVLDDSILPFASSLKGGDGMPVVFSEFGLVPFNRTTAMPWEFMPSSTPDQDEQLMGYKALIAAMDHRKADDNLLSVNLWHWPMPGTGGDFFNMYGTLPGTQFMSDFISHPVPEPSSQMIATGCIFCMIGLRLLRDIAHRVRHS